MDLSTGKNYLKLKERRIRAQTMAYISDTHDLFLTPKDSIKAYFKNIAKMAAERQKGSSSLSGNPELSLYFKRDK